MLTYMPALYPLPCPPQHVYSFDEAHPAIAEQHYLRSPDQDALLQEERRRAAAKKRA